MERTSQEGTLRDSWMIRNDLAIGFRAASKEEGVSHTLRGQVAGEAQKKGCTLVPPMGMLTCGIPLNPAA
jgi:hypothetical protein